jgi:peptide/nickel transport system substrate-binding protein
VVKNATVTVALAPGAMPNYIFPMIAPASDSCPDIFWFIEQFYRPLYYLGEKGGATFNEGLSLAYPPVFSNDGKTVTIKLKDWKWSDGKPVTTRDVEFWINILRNNRAGYANYSAGGFPDDVTTFDYMSPTTFSMTFNKKYNENWLLYNQLSMIFVGPQHAWDKTSASGTIGNYDLTAAGAQAVYKYLNAQALDVSTYQTNPLWQTVDGPYRLESYQANSEYTIVPNPNYSGAVKSHVAKIEFLEFTSDAAEYLQVLSGKIDYGYVPFADVPAANRVTAAGYRIDPWPQGGMNFAIYNFSNPTVGPLFDQLYIRQAIQSLVDQPAYIKSALDGYGVPTYGPVPAFQGEVIFNGLPEGDPTEQQNPYPYSISHAKSLLSAHGWKIVPGGVDTCQRPGTASDECGAGISAGKKLSFQFLYASGVIEYTVEIQALASAASEAGIQIVQRENSDNEIYSLIYPCTKGAACPSQMMYWYIGGFQYGMPVTYPVAPLVFACGGTGLGGYCSPTLDRLMAAAETGSSIKSLYPYEDYLSTNLPVLWLPVQPYQLSAVSDQLHGVDPQNNQETITPQFWTMSS